MKFRLTGVRIIVVSFVLVLGIAAGTIIVSPTIADTINPSQTPNFPKNENGQTYGSLLNATSSSTEPDLVEAIGVDGTSGYVKSKDLSGESPKTPEEALAKARKLKENGGPRITLYDVNGKNVIGEFHIKPGIPLPEKAEK
jgi:hypothetical protein